MLDDCAVLDRHQRASLGAGLPCMAPLDATREHDTGILADHLALVNMTQSPVVVALLPEVVQGAGCVGRVALAAVQTGVHQADVESFGLGQGKA